MQVLVVGDANPDLVLSGDTVPRFGQAEQLLDAAELALGGSAAIVACGLARLGVPTGLAAVVGADDFGRLVRERLAAASVDTSAVTTDPDLPTGMTVILQAPAAGTRSDRAILTLPGTITQLRADQVRAAVEQWAPAHVHLASFFLLPELAAELADLCRWLRGRGVSTSLDTNWDPAERWSGVATALEQVDVFLPNDVEVRRIAAQTRGVNPDAEVVVAAQALTAYGCRVVVKCGAEGGLSVGPDGKVERAPGLPVDVIDTTGAGDSFDAGYLAALVTGVAEEIVRLQWAVAAGSLSTRARGGTAGQPTRTELRAGVPE